LGKGILAGKNLLDTLQRRFFKKKYGHVSELIASSSDIKFLFAIVRNKNIMFLSMYFYKKKSA
jgi:hypothetical protein